MVNATFLCRVKTGRIRSGFLLMCAQVKFRRCIEWRIFHARMVGNDAIRDDFLERMWERALVIIYRRKPEDDIYKTASAMRNFVSAYHDRPERMQEEVKRYVALAKAIGGYRRIHKPKPL